mmetsp:Transcript_28795/g.46600  ORF Transcript_28795/g.46600 Transcript_28795/m.46600 type:complete len:296 (+) Transcript_28795:73-960(+)
MERARFSIGDRILAFYGSVPYEAKILSVQTNEEDPKEPKIEYLVHFSGWSKNWDRWINEDKVLEYNDDNCGVAKKTLEEVKQAAEREKKKRSAKPQGEDGGAGRTKKRKAGGESEEKFALNVPKNLKNVIFNDWSDVLQKQKLVPLPRKPTIAQLLEDYTQNRKIEKSQNSEEERQMAEDDEKVLAEMIEGLKHYFNKVVGRRLLYRCERLQYSNHMESSGMSKLPTDVYGAEHLLRLLVKLPDFVEVTAMEPNVMKLFMEILDDLLLFLSENQKVYFVPATSEWALENREDSAK